MAIQTVVVAAASQPIQPKLFSSCSVYAPAIKGAAAQNRTFAQS